MLTPESRLLLARFRLAVARRPDLLRRPPWYAVEGARIRAIAREAGVDPGRAVMAAATLSPACPWEVLMARLPAFLAFFRDAAEMGEERTTPPPWFPGYRANVRKAWRILAGDGKLRGPKVSRFALNLAGDESPVTVDRWAARAAGLPDSGGRTWYRRIEQAYREAARAVRLPPSRLQAILWIAVRDRVVRWGPVRDDGIAFRLFQPELFNQEPQEGPQDRAGSTIAGNLTREPTGDSPSPGASHDVYGHADLAGLRRKK